MSLATLNLSLPVCKEHRISGYNQARMHVISSRRINGLLSQIAVTVSAVVCSRCLG